MIASRARRSSLSRPALSALLALLALLAPGAGLAAQSPPFPGEIALVGLDYPVAHPRVASVGDVDQDGRPDLLVQRSDPFTAWIELRRGRGDGSFGPAEPILQLPGAPGAHFTRLVQADSDAFPDLVDFTGGIDTSRIYLGAGDGSFGPPIVLKGRNDVRDADHFATADFDLDGQMDFVAKGLAGSAIGGTISDTIGVFVAGPDGTYSGPDGFSIGQFVGLFALTTGDFDEDGFPDVLVSQGPSSAFGLRLYRGTGTGALVTTPVVTLLGAYAMSLVTADFDGDGHLDVAALETLSGPQPAVRLLLGDGTGHFATLGWLTVDAPSLYFDGRVVAGDVDGDGLLDLLVLPGAEPVLMVYRGLGGGQFAPATTHSIPSEVHDPLIEPLLRHVEVADLDLDGRSDVVISNENGNVVRPLLSAPAPFVSLGLAQPSGTAPVLSASGITLPGATLQLEVSAVPAGTMGLLLVDLATGVQSALGLQIAVPDGTPLLVTGNAILQARWPAELAPGAAIYVQGVFLGPSGYSASNALALLASP